MSVINYKRRDFIKMSALGAAAGIIMPRTVLSMENAENVLPKKILGNLIFTKDHGGRWENEKKGHLPQIEKNGSILRVSTNHDMETHYHYIVKHQIFDENFQFIDETMFTPGEEEAVSEHTIKAQGGKLYVLSVCNIHDSWMDSIDL